MPRDPADLPHQLRVARKCFERWRARRKRGDRIPDPLWHAAVKAANKKRPRTPKFLEVFPSASILPPE